jgi:predicted transcriptional regulator
MYKIFGKEIGLSFKMLFWLMYWELDDVNSDIKRIANVIYVANDCYATLNDTKPDFKSANEVLKLINDYPDDAGYQVIMEAFIAAHGELQKQSETDKKK